MNLPTNIAKSGALAYCVFWIVLIVCQQINIDMPLFVFLSIIPIFFCSTFIIITTIYPFYWNILSKNELDRIRAFKRYFPFYSILTFSISTYAIITSNFDIIVIAFFSSAFITTSQSWVWFATKNRTDDI